MLVRKFLAWAPFLIKAMSAGIIVFCTVVLIYMLGPALETRFFPVVGKLQILKVETTPEGHSKIYAAFEKRRNCKYLGISWYRGSRVMGFERVPLTLYRHPGDDGSPNRPIGFQKAGPWVVAIPPDEIRSNSFAELHHSCIPLWTTVTEFYP